MYDPGSGPSRVIESASVLILDIPFSRTMRNRFLLFTSHLVYGSLLQQLELTQRVICRFHPCNCLPWFSSASSLKHATSHTELCWVLRIWSSRNSLQLEWLSEVLLTHCFLRSLGSVLQTLRPNLSRQPWWELRAASTCNPFVFCCTKNFINSIFMLAQSISLAVERTESMVCVLVSHIDCTSLLYVCYKLVPRLLV